MSRGGRGAAYTGGRGFTDRRQTSSTLIPPTNQPSIIRPSLNLSRDGDRGTPVTLHGLQLKAMCTCVCVNACVRVWEVSIASRMPARSFFFKLVYV